MLILKVSDNRGFCNVQKCSATLINNIINHYYALLVYVFIVLLYIFILKYSVIKDYLEQMFMGAPTFKSGFQSHPKLRHQKGIPT